VIYKGIEDISMGAAVTAADTVQLVVTDAAAALKP